MEGLLEGSPKVLFSSLPRFLRRKGHRFGSKKDVKVSSNRRDIGRWFRHYRICDSFGIYTGSLYLTIKSLAFRYVTGLRRIWEVDSSDHYCTETEKQLGAELRVKSFDLSENLYLRALIRILFNAIYLIGHCPCQSFVKKMLNTDAPF
jgi:hypothetical protein